MKDLKDSDFQEIVSRCENIVVLCDLSQTLDYDANYEYRNKVLSMLMAEVKKLNAVFD